MNIHPKLQPITTYLHKQKTRLSGKMHPEQFWQITHLLLAFVCVLSLAVGYFAYQIGKRHGQQVSAVIATDYKGDNITAQQVSAIRLENDILKTEIATLTQERDISLHNLNLLKGQMQALQTDYEETKQLNEALSINKNSTLELIDVRMKSVGDNVYAYHVDVAATQAQKFTPKLTLLNATSIVEVPFEKDSYHAKGLFAIEGQFVMPTGFTPSQLKLEIIRADRTKIEKLYNWRP